MVLYSMSTILEVHGFSSDINESGSEDEVALQYAPVNPNSEQSIPLPSPPKLFLPLS